MATKLPHTAEKAPLTPLLQALLHRLHKIGELGIRKEAFWPQVASLLRHLGAQDEDREALLADMKTWGVREQGGVIALKTDPPPYEDRPLAT